MPNNLKKLLSERKNAYTTRDLIPASHAYSEKQSQNHMDSKRSSYQFNSSPVLNTLDNVLIQYGGILRNDSSDNQSSRDLIPFSDWEKENPKQRASKDNQAQLTTLKEFLTIKPEKLSPEEQKLQQALARLYRLNDRKPPLFKSFPNWRPDMPLIIDATTMPSLDCTAAFKGDENMIFFHKKFPTETLLGMLAHELKHAEQCSQELYERVYHNPNHKETQQLSFAAEIQAKSFDTYVMMLDAKERGALQNWENEIAEHSYFFGAIRPIVREHLKKDPELKNGIGLQEDLMIGLLPAMFHSDYKREYDEFFPMRGSEKDVAFVPHSFHFSEEFIQSRLLPALKQVPLRDTKINPEKIRNLIFTRKFDEARTILDQNPSIRAYLLHPVGLSVSRKHELSQVLEDYLKLNPNDVQFVQLKSKSKTSKLRQLLAKTKIAANLIFSTSKKR